MPYISVWYTVYLNRCSTNLGLQINYNSARACSLYILLVFLHVFIMNCMQWWSETISARFQQIHNSQAVKRVQ